MKSRIDPKQIQSLNESLINKKISPKRAESIAKSIVARGGNLQQYIAELFLSQDYLKISVENSMLFHLFYAHHARLLLVSSLLPKADKILDLGGANGSIYEMGYPHKFKEITVVDLPPEERDAMYKDLELKPTETPNGKIRVHFGDMSDLSFVPSNSIDLVWSGESIEHIDEDAGKRMVQEAYRVLKPGGSFCLDTPNRLVTQIHTSGFIHPEHKLEYYPKQLRTLLKRAGFKIADQRGIRDMPRTYKTKEFHYPDYVLGSPITNSVNSAYMQYYRCVKPTRRSLSAALLNTTSKTKDILNRFSLGSNSINE